MNDQDKLAGLQGKDTGTTMPMPGTTPTVALPGANVANPPLPPGANPDGTISTVTGKSPVSWQDMRLVLMGVTQHLQK